MIEAKFALTEVGPSVKQIKRARLWRKIVCLLRENGLHVHHGENADIAALQAVTEAFAADQVCVVEDEDHR